MLNKLGQVYARGKSIDDMIELIVRNKNPRELIELLKGCDIYPLQLRVLEKLECAVISGFLLRNIDKQRLLRYLFTTGINIHECFARVSRIMFHENPDTPESPSPSSTNPTISLMCRICCDKDIEVVFLPCGHIYACEECAERMDACPICKATAFLRYKRIYFP